MLLALFSLGKMWVTSDLHVLPRTSVKLIYQFLYLINSYLLFRCLEKVFKEDRNKNKKGNIWGVTGS